MCNHSTRMEEAMLTSKQGTSGLSSQVNLQAPWGIRRCSSSHRIAIALNASREGCAETRPNDGSRTVLHRLGTSGSAQIGGCISVAGRCCGSAGLHRRTEAAVSGQSYTASLPLRTFTDLYRRLGCCPIWRLLRGWWNAVSPTAVARWAGHSPRWQCTSVCCLPAFLKGYSGPTKYSRGMLVFG